MKKYKEGTKFTVCSRTELKNKGWRREAGNLQYTHDDFPKCVLSFEMLDNHSGQTLTVYKEDPARENWYTVSENTHYIWPVATFLEEVASSGSSDHECEEGMTEIFGWMICKTCGKDLRQIR